MKIIIKIPAFLVSVQTIISCRSTPAIDVADITVSDVQASLETKILCHCLGGIAKTGVALGHQDAKVYGIGWKHEEHPITCDSDIKRVTGKFPAVHILRKKAGGIAD